MTELNHLWIFDHLSISINSYAHLYLSVAAPRASSGLVHQNDSFCFWIGRVFTWDVLKCSILKTSQQWSGQNSLVPSDSLIGFMAVMQNENCTYRMKMNWTKVIVDIAFFKWAIPGLFFIYFRSFQTNIITIFTTNYLWNFPI